MKIIINRIPAMVPLTAPLFGVFFLGAYLPQKMDLFPPLERERNSVQKHVLSYQIEISPDCFVLVINMP
jgi:hypothetical protein